MGRLVRDDRKATVTPNNHSLQPRYIEYHLGQYKIGKSLPGLMSLDLCCNIQMVESEFGVKNMDPSCLVSTVQAVGVMVWGIFSWHTLGPLVPTEHRLNATVYLSIIADHVHPFMTTVYHLLMATSSRIMHHVTKLKSSQTGFLNMTMSSLYSNSLHNHQISIQ